MVNDNTSFRMNNLNIQGDEVPRIVRNHIDNSLPRKAKNYRRYQGDFGSTRCTGYGPSAAVQIYEKFYQTMEWKNKSNSLNTTSNQKPFKFEKTDNHDFSEQNQQ